MHRSGISSTVVCAIVVTFWLAVTLAPAQDFPALSGRVVDAANILNAATKALVSSQLKSHEEATSDQVVVVTIPALQGYDIADYGYQLGRHWGIGQEGKDNGALLIIAPNERKVRIEVGYGLEGSLTDAEAKLIVEREILPAFRRNDFNAGVRNGARAMIEALSGIYEGPMAGGKIRRNVTSLWQGLVVGTLLLLMLGFGFYQLVSEPDGGPRRSGRGTHDHNHSSGGYRGRGGRGGGFSGGGGGFGGGGASGGW